MSRKKRPIYTADAETDPFKRNRDPMPFLWGLYNGEPGGFREFPTAEAMLRYLHTLGPIIVYAHNGGKFDWIYMFPFLEAYTEVLIISGRIARFTIGEIEFRDSWNILPVPLAKLGKGSIEFWKLEADVRHLHMEEIRRYNKQDCVALWDSVALFTEMYGTKLTLASAALDFWSKHFDHEIPKSDAFFYERMKPYYSGGRVECFHKGMIEGDFHVVDINSAYPYAMTHKHPLSTEYDPIIPKKDAAIIPQSFYRIEGIASGSLPFKDEHGALKFPNDGETREFQISGWEFQAALDTKTLRNWKVLERRDFLKEIDFCDYVDHFYAMKAAAPKESSEYQFAKLMQNALYGKFGACPEHYASYGIVPVQDICTVIQDPTISLGRNQGPWDWAGSLGEFALMEGKCPVTGERNPVQSDYYNVATAASITGFVRAFLWRHICKVKALGGQVLYCDTDSIVFKLPKGKKMPFDFSKKLGDWTDEGEKCGGFHGGAIAGKKMYAFQAKDESHWKKACKGVKLEAPDILRIAQGETITWKAEAPQPDIKRKMKKGERVVPKRYIARRVRMT